MPFTHRVTVIRMNVPLQAQTAVDMAVVLSQPEVQRGGEGGDQRDIGERAAHEVVAAMRWPVDEVVQVGQDEHARLGESPAARPACHDAHRRA